MSRPLRVRFAPSPTGSLHLGNARTALFNWLVARQTGGVLVLRIEDTDTDREQTGSEQGILEDLRWLGLDWDEGPDAGGEFGPYRQSQRRQAYEAAAEKLLCNDKAYRCFCTEEEQNAERDALRAAGEVPGYQGKCGKIDRSLSDRRAGDGEPFALRFRTLDAGQDPETAEVRFTDRLRGEVSFLAKELGDPVMVRRDGRATYNFAVVVDDAAMKIDLVLRGDDHLSNTPRQVLYFRALKASLPEFAHLPMVRGTDGERLSKRHGATSVSEYREGGYLPAGVLNALVLLGWGPKGDESNILTTEEMIRRFDLDRLSRSPSIFDPVKLGKLTATHIQKMPEEELGMASSHALVTGRLLPETVLGSSCDVWRGGLARLVRDGIERFGQTPERAAALFHPGGAAPSPEEEVHAAISAESFPVVLKAMLEQVGTGAPETVEEWKEFRKAVQSLSGVKGKGLFHAIRVALTGAIHGPELDRLVPLITSGAQLFPDSIPSMESRVRTSLEQVGD